MEEKKWILSDYQVNNIKKELKNIYFLPNYITEQEENLLLSTIYNVPTRRWVQLQARRLQNWGGLPPKSENEYMIEENLNPVYQNFCDRLKKTLFLRDEIGEEILFFQNTPNHILINEYLPGQGILVS